MVINFMIEVAVYSERRVYNKGRLSINETLKAKLDQIEKSQYNFTLKFQNNHP